ncbi:hypothetical protein [Streptomyces sp. NPDC002057]|uniref:hypothetical protein n=1 Tax=Streptomyces sp. NPDC002057 TaxID=3154664 RepID=UPI003331B9A7
MDTPRASSSRVGARLRAALRTRSPRATLCGYLLLLALVFAGAYGLGAAVGPGGPGDDGRPGREPTRPPSPTPTRTHDTDHTHGEHHG